MARRFPLHASPSGRFCARLRCPSFAARRGRRHRDRAAAERAAVPGPRQAGHPDPVPDDRRRRLHRRGRRQLSRACPLSRAPAAGRAQSGAQGDRAALLPRRLLQRLDQPARHGLRAFDAGARGGTARRSREAVRLLCRAPEGFLHQRRGCRARAQHRAPGARLAGRQQAVRKARPQARPPAAAGSSLRPMGDRHHRGHRRLSSSRMRARSIAPGTRSTTSISWSWPTSSRPCSQDIAERALAGLEPRAAAARARSRSSRRSSMAAPTSSSRRRRSSGPASISRSSSESRRTTPTAMGAVRTLVMNFLASRLPG